MAQARWREVQGHTAAPRRPTGCGLCGIEQQRSHKAKPVFHSPCFDRIGPNRNGCQSTVRRSTSTGRRARLMPLAFHSPIAGLVAAREDVGRHNALDKLAIAHPRGADGAIVLTSRVSVEMVQKTAAIGSSISIAISAPRALAVRTAHACGITLVAIARGSEFEISSTHPDGITRD
ncbi:MAG: formate dehydrogenase accessory sulfurtransferase FdhD [Candidatus Dormibacteraeota bacterium]|nr:formate dehydrogenase accessory sulfurtransferase FdhD [Candidatus Dormibacteraeota bacterium]